MSWVQSQFQRKDGFLTHPPSISPLFSPSISSSPPNSNYQKELTPHSSGSKISPAIIFIVVIIAAIFFISSLLHLFVKFLAKQYSSSSTSQSNRYTEFNSGSDVLQRQLQQLFHLHDSGLDQALIDSLPVFLYKEIMGLKEAFDCAVCLCEFSEQDKLRLLPLCSHAFHVDCIDKWLLSNSTCPLCRGTLFTPGLPIENPIFVLDDSREENELQEVGDDGFSSSGQKPEEIEGTISEARVFPVRLGKFRTINNGGERGEAESSSNNLDARRCYSMGSLQYVVGDSNLQVALSNDRDGNSDLNIVKGTGGGQNGYSLFNRDMEGKKLNNRSKGESFSVSKIWLWSKQDKLSSASNNFLP
ncbi:zinc finger protein [Macleaya cordata]|uniref:RING-type E3 ubiquitin transferase n=1 Tax=Macleaya cordata TaxID=56857 RepID=A0A200R0P8_MACCD|nr:zinc finger protein [Macleaya cordata]